FSRDWSSDVCSSDLSGSDRLCGARLAERGHELPEGGYPESGGLRGDGEARPPGQLQEPRVDERRSRRACRVHPALHRPRLPGDPCSQREPEPGKVYRGVRQARVAEAEVVADRGEQIVGAGQSACPLSLSDLIFTLFEWA